jgi:hypothetical protein
VIDKLSNDSGFLKDWNLIQIEGEEPAEAVVEDPKAKGKAPPAKAKGVTSALEEITDNRPRIINFEKKFGTEGEAGKAISINEEIANYFEGFLMPITIWSVNRETQEEKLCETYELDLSPLLFETEGNKEMKWEFDKLKTMEFLYLNISVHIDQPLLNNFLRRKLNPL